ncbi:hypothetical protein [Tenacibaculum sp. nBUS_03]|uniref:hypothetical protein n=1 Tax=Tenacibaculum sp. nBUS_03 TaxID=3395320 RepID=UPI003EBDDB1E
MKQNKETLKAYFETGDKPTQQQFSDLIDSFIDTKQPVGENNRTFTINQEGNVSLITKEKSVFKTAKIFISETELESGETKIIIPAQGENTIIDILSVNTVFNFNGNYYGDSYLLFNQGIAAISLSNINGGNYVVKTSQSTQESRSIPINTPFTVSPQGTINAGNDGLTIYATYRVITTDGYKITPGL